jgi:two-component system, OmpR family, response regulator VicR
MSDKPRILYVEDDEVLSFVTKDNLEMNNFEVVHSAEGEEALRLFKSDDFDLCIVDVMLPKMDGYTLAIEIRKRNQSIPILFLTAKSLKEDKIHGLQIGGDDYITKPFSIEELILKIKVFLRRKELTQTVQQADYVLSNYTLETKNLRLIHKDGSTRDLTQKEADLLQFFIQNLGNIVKREEILERVWGENDYFMGRSMDVFISRLRKYLGKDSTLKLENIHGIGFRLTDDNV